MSRVTKERKMKGNQGVWCEENPFEWKEFRRIFETKAAEQQFFGDVFCVCEEGGTVQDNRRKVGALLPDYIKSIISKNNDRRPPAESLGRTKPCYEVSIDLFLLLLLWTKRTVNLDCEQRQKMRFIHGYEKKLPIVKLNNGGECTCDYAN